jgi:hypothetical protein
MTSRRWLQAFAGVLCIAAPMALGCAAGSDGWAPSTSATAEGGAPPGAPPGPPGGPRGAGGGAIVVPYPGPQPYDGPHPPPVSGGTLMVMHDGNTAVAADPDRDVVWVVDLAARSRTHTIKLKSGDEPGRVVEDGTGIVHVLLRRGGAMVAIDPALGTVLSRTPVCPAPRGLAYDDAADALHVACADGRLFTFPAAGGSATSVTQVAGDLRDVIVQGGSLFVTTFRSAQVLQLASDGTIAQGVQLPPSESPQATPDVAWRAVAVPGGGIAVLHQRALDAAVSTDPGGYNHVDMPGGPCPGVGIIQDVVTVVQPGNAPPIAPALADMALAVDVAVSADGTQVAVVSASPFNVFPSNVAVYAMSDVTSSTGCCTASGPATMRAQATAVAFDGSGDVVAFLREPAAIFVGSSISTSFPLGSVTIPLGGTTLADDGHDTFHTVTAAALACASCHPEAGDDGRVWQFAGIGPRRTQNIRGGVLARVPFHWSGDVPDMDALVADVLVGRMDGTALSSTQTTDLGTWMDAQPALLPPPPADPAAVARGQALFEDASVGCAGCHDGPQLSDHQIVDVGTGDTGPEPFKVPSLIAVGYRAPYLHNGCAATLLDRFSPPCGGGNQHGNTLQLSADQIGDLVAYLQSL